MMEKQSKQIWCLIGILFLVFLGLIIFLVRCGLHKKDIPSSGQNVLIPYIERIQQENDKLTELNKKLMFNNENVRETLPKILNALLQVKKDLNTLNSSTKNNKDFQYLASGLENNILIYKQAIIILDNPGAKDLELAAENLKNYGNTCMNYYSLIQLKETSLSLPSSCLKLINSTVDFSSQAVRLRKDVEIKSSQREEFIDKIDALSEDLSKLEQDFFPEIIKARTTPGHYDTILLVINIHKEHLRKIEKELQTLSIPKEGMEVYDVFSIWLKAYDNYLQNLSFALLNEKEQIKNASVDTGTLDSFYVTPKKIFSDVEVSHRSFSEIYAEFKKENLKNNCL